MNKVDYIGEQCEVVISMYPTGNKRIDLINEIGFPIATASTDPWFDLNNEEVCIKNYSENEGIKEALLEAGILVGNPLDSIDNGYTVTEIYQLNPSIFE